MSNNHNTFSLRGRIRSSTHALQGLRELVMSQHNAWIEATATVCVIAAGAFFGVTATQWCLLALAITVVWAAEALNTAIEFLCDVASPEFHPLVKKSKDVAAAAVLLSAIGAAVVGLVIFVPYFLAYL